MPMRIQELLPGTQERVDRNTNHDVKGRIDHQTEQNVTALAGAAPSVIDQRIAELQREWDVERALEANAALVILTSTAMGVFVNRKWFAVTAAASVFLLQHALQGWCPPLPILRRLGVRTYSEIDEEKEALRILRGDFHPTQDPADAIAQARGKKLS